MKQENTQRRGMNRRTFLNQAAGLAAGAAAGMTAGSYSRILNANDRISLGHIGVGNRGADKDLSCALS